MKKIKKIIFLCVVATLCSKTVFGMQDGTPVKTIPIVRENGVKTPFVALVHSDNSIFVKDLDTGVIRKIASASKSALKIQYSFSPDGKKLAFWFTNALKAGVLKIYNTTRTIGRRGRGCLKQVFIKVRRHFIIDKCLFSPDNRYLLTSVALPDQREDKLHLFDIQEDTEVVLAGAFQNFATACFSKNSVYLAVLSGQNRVCLYGLNGDARLLFVQLFANKVENFSFRCNGRYLIISFSVEDDSEWKSEVMVFDMEKDGATLSEKKVLNKWFSQKIIRRKFMCNKSLLLTFADKTIKLFDLFGQGSCVGQEILLEGLGREAIEDFKIISFNGIPKLLLLRFSGGRIRLFNAQQGYREINVDRINPLALNYGDNGIALTSYYVLLFFNVAGGIKVVCLNIYNRSKPAFVYVSNKEISMIKVMAVDGTERLLCFFSPGNEMTVLDLASNGKEVLRDTVDFNLDEIRNVTTKRCFVRISPKVEQEQITLNFYYEKDRNMPSASGFYSFMGFYSKILNGRAFTKIVGRKRGISEISRPAGAGRTGVDQTGAGIESPHVRKRRKLS